MRAVNRFLVLLVCATVLLSAVAMWYDTLKIHAEIETGEVDVEFGDVWCEETPEAEGKDVGSCSAALREYVDEDLGNPSGDDDLDLFVTVSNAYPGYSARVCFEVVNSGTVPAVGPWPTLELPDLPDWLVVSHTIVPVQIDPDGAHTFCLRISVYEDLEAGIEPPEGYTYAFQVHMRFVQWNEATYGILELELTMEFRETNANLKACPARLGDPLAIVDEHYIVNATVVKGKVNNVNPGALFGVIWITGAGVAEISVVDRYDFHFDVVNGVDGKVRAYVYDATTGCVVKELKLTEGVHYTIDNDNGEVAIYISLGEPLGPGQAVLIYLKFKDTLKDMEWGTLDKFFENEATIATNLGSGDASAVIKIVAKK